MLELISSRKNFIDGVTVTGGEPTLAPDLPEFLAKLKKVVGVIKLDSNGYQPDVLSDLFKNGLVDFVAMDIKTSMPKYSQAAGTTTKTDRIEKSIDLIMGSGIDYEFRTTVTPGFVEIEDVEAIVKRISGARSYSIQQFSNRNTLDPELQNIKPHLPEILKKMGEIAEKNIKNVTIRGI